MPFQTHLHTRPGIVVLELHGDLDSTTAPVFRTAVEEAVGVEASRFVLDLTHLDYLSSAGLRVLVFARQKTDPGVDLVLVGANEAVTETIRLTGFHHSVTFSEHVPG